MGDLDGIRALVTGGTSGIGAAIVARLRVGAAAVAVTGRDAQRGEEVARRTGSSFVRADLRDPDAVGGSVREAVAVLGGLDALVLNAGVLHEAPLSETTDWLASDESSHMTGATLRIDGAAGAAMRADTRWA